jgi:methylisocitrate lyase
MDRADCRRLLRRPAQRLVVAPLALDALSAALAKRVGFDVVYLGGGALGYVRGVSEALLTATELAEATRAITEQVEVHVLVDGTTGFGDAVHTARTVRLVERAGAAGIELEDQPAPKRAHHQKHSGGLDHIVSTEEMAGKIGAAVDARDDPDFLIVARCNGRWNDSVSLDETVERCAAYEAAGADLLLVFPRTPDEVRAIAAATAVPLATMTPTGLTPDELAAAGYPLSIDAYSATVVGYRALKQAYERLRDGLPVTETFEEALDVLREVGETIGMQALYDIEAKTTERALYAPAR